MPQGGAHGKDISKKLICQLVASDANRKEQNVQKLICQLVTRDANGKENVDKKTTTKNWCVRLLRARRKGRRKVQKQICQLVTKDENGEKKCEDKRKVIC